MVVAEDRPVAVLEPAEGIETARADDATFEVQEPKNLPLLKIERRPRVKDIVSRDDVVSATPSAVIFGDLHHPQLRLRRGIPLRVERDGDTVVVISDDLGDFGYGGHLTEALEDFRVTLLELFFTLEEEQATLGPAMIQHWRKLNEIIEHR